LCFLYKKNNNLFFLIKHNYTMVLVNWEGINNIRDEYIIPEIRLFIFFKNVGAGFIPAREIPPDILIWRD